jgi:hypothetical protein
VITSRPSTIFIGPPLPFPESWEEILNSVEVHAQREIDRFGAFTVSQRSGIFICKS